VASSTNLSTPRSATQPADDELDHAADHAEHRRSDQRRLTGPKQADLHAGLERAAQKITHLGEVLIEALGGFGVGRVVRREGAASRGTDR